ncbi:PIG-L family deacetylase [Angustibacter luteus]|uniref:PIG-L family deacetylase n=1 Tax=Angustibacter luteus TaxID=658456 RepID=A0ABW1JAI2_9ACTN
MTFQHTDAGTPEAHWRDWLRTRSLPGLDPDRLLAPGGRLLVLAAHPDDETLGAGGLIAIAAERGLDVDVVIATAGEGSHPQSSTLRGDLARLRSREVVRAVTQLAPTASVHLLDLPDGGLTECAVALADQLSRLARPAASPSGRAVTVLAAPWRRDAHPDHEAAGAVAAELAGALEVPLLEYPIWAWHWAEVGDVRVPWGTAMTLGLSPKTLQHKRSAMACHESQTEPLSAEPGDEALLSAAVLAHFEREVEVFFASDPSASLPAGYFEDFYAGAGPDPWGFETRWYEQRKRALTLASLPRQRFRRAFEPGCSTGLLTAELATRCDEVIALDVAATAVEQARTRTRDLAGVQVARGAIPDDWPAGTFDLILLSEVAYYCAGADLDDLVRRAGDCLADDGVLVACHWRHPVDDYPVGGDLVHARLRQHPRLRLLAAHEEEDFLLDVLVPVQTLSVARQAGLTD